ncbi:hypothetical protein GCM10007167_08860 [Vulcaniibacterium thermophilum]|uniref:Rhamnogalacturonase A/B/Epimerase-like pectate lyase domain-containing protein n=2 Tax=Vulcaniibacterium thermophilum TaxID=1169913 RepID=A0A918YXV0_9GAMM|nr:hypothetical protein GCM10007167_08860 [Vulcaniibacterium thermophilum]
MKQNELVHVVPEARTPRREFLRTSMLLAVPAMLGGVALPKVAKAAYVPPTRARGTTRLNVKNYGALGNGTANDTAAIQRAINALPSTGGTVYIPAGTYMIDAVKSIRLRSKMHLQLDPAAKLVAIPNAALKAYVVLADKVTDIEISGGQIIGERYGHRRTDGEWGHAVMIRGSKRVTVRDIRLADCYGDGLSIGAASVWNGTPIMSEDVVIANMVSHNNRRQALTIGRSKYVQVHDSVLSGTNGVAPECGIDIEPDLPEDGGYTDNVVIQNCVVKENAKYGINIFKSVRNVTIRGCTIERNKSCGVVTVGCTGIRLEANTIRYNSATGVYLQTNSSTITITGNTFYGNYARLGIQTRTAFTLTGWSSRIERDILYKDSVSGLKILTNYYR